MLPTLETEVCVVGAGPAGLMVASELVAHGMDVLVLESGTEQPEARVRLLNEGVTSGDPYAGLAVTRHRGVGGTMGIWNTVVRGEVAAKCVPLDPVDFEFRPGRTLSGWPFDLSELQPYYARALRWCGLGTTSFETSAWERSPRQAFRELSSPLLTRVYQLCSRRALLEASLAALGGPGERTGARLRCDATVLRLELEAGRDRVATALVSSLDGGRFRVAANRFVLAAGAVENARLLLVSHRERGGVGNEADLVGRCFMEHPRDTSLRLHPRSPDLYRACAFYDLHQAANGTSIFGRLALEREALLQHDLPNASGTLLPRVRGVVRQARRTLEPLARFGCLDRLLPRGGHGWTVHPAPRIAFDGLTLLLNLEQLPHPENRIRLAADVDAFGVPRAELRWRWRLEDQARLERLRRLLTATLEASGLFTVSIDPDSTIDPNAHHHAGTTRMHVDPESGVVDPYLRVHGVDNVYVAGASVFPTAGFANPLLTILALSSRLADHLASDGRVEPTGARNGCSRVS